MSPIADPLAARFLKAGVGCAALAGRLPTAFAQGGGAQTGPRVDALGWACAQTLLALGVVPLVVPEIERYGKLVVEPAVPSNVREIGLRSEPNLELRRASVLISSSSIPALWPRSRA